MSDQLRLGVIGGTGAEGRGLALRFAIAGAAVTLGSREPARAREAAAHLRRQHPQAHIEGASHEDAIAQNDIVILAIPFVHAGPWVEAHGRALAAGALVVDVTVPVVFEGGRPRFVEPAEGSAAEHLRARLPEHVALACAFKTLPARMLQNADVALDCDEFVCGDSPASRQRLAALVERLPGLRPVDAGPLEAARILERMTLLAIMLNKRYKSHDARFRVLGV
jgi:8-hydroxy-5-deazaflavin:NADPH oxidoreductase